MCIRKIFPGNNFLPASLNLLINENQKETDSDKDNKGLIIKILLKNRVLVKFTIKKKKKKHVHNAKGR